MCEALILIVTLMIIAVGIVFIIKVITQGLKKRKHQIR